MEKKDTRRDLGSYSVDHGLLRNLEDFIDTRMPRILNTGDAIRNFPNYTTLTLVGLKEGTAYRPANSYTDKQFPDDTDVLRIELLYADDDSEADTRAIALILRLGASHSDSELSIALHGENANEKIAKIEEGLLAVLEPNKNLNRVLYPNEFMPTLIFVIGFFIGIGALMFSQPILRALCIALSGAAVYVVGRRFSKGYCSFDSRRQRQLDVFFRWFTTILLLCVFGAILVSMIQKV